jgi:hypothetical protein
MFFDWAFEKLNLKNMEDWYKVDVQHLKQIGADTLISKYYKDDLSRALSVEFSMNFFCHEILQVIYPEYRWHAWKFRSDEETNSHEKILKEFEGKFGILVPEDWLGITYQHLQNNDLGKYLLSHYGGSIIELLKAHYPNKEWKV